MTKEEFETKYLEIFTATGGALRIEKDMELFCDTPEFRYAFVEFLLTRYGHLMEENDENKDHA